MSRMFLTTKCTGLIVMAIAGAAHGQDNCSAPVVVVGHSAVFDTTAATTDAPTQSNCGSSVQITKDVWYRWTAPCSSSVTASVCGATFDTKLAVYGSCPVGDNTALACNDDSNVCGVNSLRSNITFNAVAGTSYLFRIGGVSGASGTGTLTVLATNCPPNDLCPDATVISAYGAIPFTNVGATNSGPTPMTCGTGNAISADIWFTYSSCVAGSHTINTCTGGNFDTVLLIYTGPCDALTQISCSDDGCGPAGLYSSAVWDAAANTLYHIRVGGYQGSVGTGILTLTGPVCPPPNDLCADATVISAYGALPFTNVGATNSGPIPTTCGTGNAISADIWFTYSSCVAGSHSINTCTGGNFDTVLLIYTGPCDALTQISCSDDGCGPAGLYSSAVWDAAANTLYHIRVGGYQGSVGTGILTLTGPVCPVPPTNDNCINRKGIALGGTPFSTIDATTDGPAHALCDNAGSNQITNDIWYNYPSQCTGTLTVDTCTTTNFDSKVAVYAYNGTCATINDLTLQACNDDACGSAGLASRVSVSVQPGLNYAIRVGGFNGATGTGTLTLTCTLAGDINCDNAVNPLDVPFFITALVDPFAFAGCDINRADMNTDASINGRDIKVFVNAILAP